MAGSHREQKSEPRNVSILGRRGQAPYLAPTYKKASSILNLASEPAATSQFGSNSSGSFLSFLPTLRKCPQQKCGHFLKAYASVCDSSFDTGKARQIFGERFLRPGGQDWSPLPPDIAKTGNARKNIASVSCAREGREGVGKIKMDALKDGPEGRGTAGEGLPMSLPRRLGLRPQDPPNNAFPRPNGCGESAFMELAKVAGVPPPPVFPPRRFHAQGVEPVPGLPYRAAATGEILA